MDVAISLTYAELLALHSCVSTINCVYGENEVRSGLLDSLSSAIRIASDTHVVEIEVEAGGVGTV